MSVPEPAFTICLTHDVDRVRKTWQYLTHDIIQGRWRRLRTLLSGERPYWMFDRLMKIEEAHGVRSTLFFLEETMTARMTSPKSWKLAYGRYSYDMPEIRQVIRELDAGGWEIGVHGSYLSYRSVDLLRREKDRLEQVLGKAVCGIRQHYLNLDIPDTWYLQKEVGFGYDASYGKKQDIGFLNERYQPFVDQSSGIVVIPLALMEGYLFGIAGNDVEAAWKMTLELIDEAERNRATFVVLWHQRMFNEEEFPGLATVYERLIVEGKGRGAEFLTCGQIYDRALADSVGA